MWAGNAALSSDPLSRIPVSQGCPLRGSSLCPGDLSGVSGGHTAPPSLPPSLSLLFIFTLQQTGSKTDILKQDGATATSPTPSKPGPQFLLLSRKAFLCRSAGDTSRPPFLHVLFPSPIRRWLQKVRRHTGFPSHRLQSRPPSVPSKFPLVKERVVFFLKSTFLLLLFYWGDTG